MLASLVNLKNVIKNSTSQKNVFFNTY